MRIAIIPARSGSSRIKKKNIYPFCGRPLISYPLEAAKACGVFDKIHVSTDSPEFAEVAERLGHPVDFLRAPELAHNNSSLIETLSWCLDQYDQRGESYDQICMIYATAPLIEAEDIRLGWQLFAENKERFPVLTVGSFPAPIERAFKIDADGVMRWVSPENRYLHSQACLRAYFDAAGFFIISRTQLCELGNRIPEEFLPLVLPRWKATDINDPEDLEIAEILYRGIKAKAAVGHGSSEA